MQKKILHGGVIVILITICAVLALFTQEYRSKANVAEQQLNGINKLLGSYGHRPYGLSCGILSPSLASSVLESSAVLQQESGLRTYTFGEDNEQAVWSDACLYERSDTRSQYVQLYITTYESEDVARSELKTKIPLVNDQEVLKDNENELTIYDAGVIYSAQGRTIIEVAAANGKPAETRSHVQGVFKTLIDQLKEY